MPRAAGEGGLDALLSRAGARAPEPCWSGETIKNGQRESPAPTLPPPNLKEPAFLPGAEENWPQNSAAPPRKPGCLSLKLSRAWVRSAGRGPSRLQAGEGEAMPRGRSSRRRGGCSSRRRLKRELGVPGQRTSTEVLGVCKTPDPPPPPPPWCPLERSPPPAEAEKANSSAWTATWNPRTSSSSGMPGFPPPAKGRLRSQPFASRQLGALPCPSIFAPDQQPARARGHKQGTRPAAAAHLRRRG